MLASRLVDMSDAVALRKESVDRNPPITMLHLPRIVALRKESVDRNYTRQFFQLRYFSRSPQGECG